MMARRAFGARLLAMAAFGGILGAAGAVAAAQAPATAAQRLEVPYVPQSGVLCGGAALAMVFRYWGETGTLAEDFTDLLEPDRGGIPTGAMVRAAASRGWNAIALQGTPAAAREHLAQGRPLITLLRTGSGAYHYVVVVGWTDGVVTFHDPQKGPYRSLPEAAFGAAWSGGESWALLILPSATAPAPPAPAPVPTSTRLGPASERFRAGDWSGAAALAEQVLASAPDDVDAWRLLAGSRFLAGDVDGALRAWNHLSEPRLDLLRLEGSRRIRYTAVADQVALPPGRLLTPRAYHQARRRLDEVPAVQAFRLELRPRAGGIAQVDAALLERPLIDTSRLGLAVTAARAVARRKLAVEVASPTGNGELWTAVWRWERERPLLSVMLAVPAVGGRPGLWNVAGLRERQAYASPVPGADGAGAVVREERRRLAVSVADWLAADRGGLDLRLEAGAAVDTWSDRGPHLGLAGGCEARRADDRLGFAAAAGAWRSLQRDEAFAALSLSASWISAGPPAGGIWVVNLGLSGVTRAAPLALWVGAGTGEGRDPLLRAHPLLDDGVIDSGVFGRRLACLTIERQAWPWRAGPVQAGWALFLDAADAGLTRQPGDDARQADVGAGLRARIPGFRGDWRLDVAQGLVDGHRAVSLAWQGP